MIGAIIGNIAGSRFEKNNHLSKDFDLFGPGTAYTGDTVMTLAVCDALIRSFPAFEDLPQRTTESLQMFGRRNPDRGYSPALASWIASSDPQPYNSFGNGGPARAAACGWAGGLLHKVQSLSQMVTAVTHDHPEAIKGAEAIATAVFLAQNGADREELHEWITQQFYPLDFTLDDIRGHYTFDPTSQGSVPQALQAFFESDSFEDAIRNAVFIGGDSDTIATMTGAVAEAFYGVPTELRKAAEAYLPDPLKLRLLDFERHFSPNAMDGYGPSGAPDSYVELCADFPVCNYTEHADNRNLGFCKGVITPEGVPFVAELFADYGQLNLGIVVPYASIDAETLGESYTGPSGAEQPDKVTCLRSTGEIQDFGILDLGMIDEGFEESAELTQDVVEWLVSHGLVQFTSTLHNGLVLYRTDSSGANILKIIVTLFENGQTLGTTPLEFESFPKQLEVLQKHKHNIVPFPGKRATAKSAGAGTTDNDAASENKKAESLRDRFQACLLGGAVGDALGYTVEFWSEDTIRQKYGADGITDYELDDGTARISDDTQMTLFTANGLLLAEEDNAREDPDRYGWRERISEAYADWLRTQQGQKGGLKSWLNNLPELNVRRAPGGTCLAYLVPGSMGSMREPRNDSKGCGGVMRVAPVALYFHSSTDEERLQADLVAAEAAAITHGHELGYIPAAVLVHMLQDILYRDFSVRDALHEAMSAAQALFSPAGDKPAVNSRYAPTRPARHLDQLLQLLRRAEELADAADVSDLDAIHALGEGWVAEETLAIAVFCALRHEDSFEKAVIAAVNHKGDSDSTGSVAGILMGARLGLDAIPDRFLQNLELEPVIVEIADDLLDGKSDSPRWKAKYQTHDYDGK